MLFTEQPHVVLAIFGEQGTGKTTAVKVLVRILDPGPVPVRKPPRDADSWVTAAAGSWVVGLDNLSDIPPWLSDSLCRASTGDGDVRRKLYTDGDYAVFAFRRCIIFDAIDVGALEPDLADRALPVTLALIPDEDRRDEETLLAQLAGRAPAAPRRRARPRRAPSWPGSRTSSSPASRAWPTTPASSPPSTPSSGRTPLTGTPSRPRTWPPRACPATRSQPASCRWSRPLRGHLGEAACLVRPADDGVEAAEGLASLGAGRHRADAEARPSVPQDRLEVDELPRGHDNAIRWKISPLAQTEKAGEDARARSQGSQESPGASNASEREQESGPSPSAGQEEKPPACPRHQKWGPHRDCLDCRALAAIQTSAGIPPRQNRKRVMTGTAIRHEVVKLLADVDIVALDEHKPTPDEAFRELRHYDGRQVTPFEAKQIAGATLDESAHAVTLARAIAEAHSARADDMRRFSELARAHWDGDQPDTTIGDALAAMTDAERAEADAILARLNGDSLDYLIAIPVLTWPASWPCGPGRPTRDRDVGRRPRHVPGRRHPACPAAHPERTAHRRRNRMTITADHLEIFQTSPRPHETDVGTVDPFTEAELAAIAQYQEDTEVTLDCLGGALFHGAQVFTEHEADEGRDAALSFAKEHFGWLDEWYLALDSLHADLTFCGKYEGRSNAADRLLEHQAKALIDARDKVREAILRWLLGSAGPSATDDALTLANGYVQLHSW